jgi:hypothetical protein
LRTGPKLKRRYRATLSRQCIQSYGLSFSSGRISIGRTASVPCSEPTTRLPWSFRHAADCLGDDPAINSFDRFGDDDGKLSKSHEKIVPSAAIDTNFFDAVNNVSMI